MLAVVVPLCLFFLLYSVCWWRCWKLSKFAFKIREDDLEISFISLNRVIYIFRNRYHAGAAKRGSAEHYVLSTSPKEGWWPRRERCPRYSWVEVPPLCSECQGDLARIHDRARDEWQCRGERLGRCHRGQAWTRFAVEKGNCRSRRLFIKRKKRVAQLAPLFQQYVLKIFEGSSL